MYTHHDRLVIPRLAQAMCILLLTGCCYNVDHQIGNACWQLCENASWGNVCILLDCKALSSILPCLQLLKSDLAMVFCLVSLGVTDYSWEIVGMDLVTELTTSSKFHLATILDFCLPFDMAHFLLCHKKSPLTKLWLSLLIIVLDFMVFHKSLCLNDTLPCWRNSETLMRKLNTKLIRSSARRPQIDALIARVDVKVQINLRCYSLGSAFWLNTLFTHGWFLL